MVSENIPFRGKEDIRKNQFSTGPEVEESGPSAAEVYLMTLEHWLKKEGIEPASAKILELGSGTGGFLQAAKKKGYDIVGIDARPRDHRPSPMVGGRIEQLPFADQSFDVVSSVLIFDTQIYHQDKHQMKKEIARVLRVGGVYAPLNEMEIELGNMPAGFTAVSDSDYHQTYYKKTEA